MAKRQITRKDDDDDDDEEDKYKDNEEEEEEEDSKTIPGISSVYEIICQVDNRNV